MIINFYATLRQIVGQRAVEIGIDREATIQALIDRVIQVYPPMRHELLNPEGELYPHVHVFVNGRDAPYLPQGLETRLNPDDKIDIFPAVGGG
jgi:sulfur-carrier protein